MQDFVEIPAYTYDECEFFFLVDRDDLELIASRNWKVFRKHTGYAAMCEIYDKTRPPKNRRRVSMHRMIMGEPPSSLWVDHINRNTLDNRRCNLRVCSPRENRLNSIGWENRPTSSRFKGVHVDRKTGLFQAEFYKARGKEYRVRLGKFASEIEAALAYDAAARKFYGSYGRYNFPLPGELLAHTEKYLASSRDFSTTPLATQEGTY